MALPFVILCSVLIQFAAAIYALRLIKVTGGRKSWIFIACGLFGMGIRRAMPLYYMTLGGGRHASDLQYELIGLLTSLCMLAGIAWIAPLFIAVRESEEKVRRSEEKYRRIVDTAQEGIWNVDSEGRTLFVNGRMATMIGLTPEEMIGRNLMDFIYDSPETAVGQIMERRRRGIQDNYDTRMRRSDGSPIWVMISGNPIFDDKGGFVGALGMVADISERKKLEIEQERLIADLQNALSNVKTLSGLLPICASCKKIRDDKGYWSQIESYIRIHSEAEFSHGICPDCAKKMYSDFVE